MNISKIQNYNTQQTSFGAVSPKFKPARLVFEDGFTKLSTGAKDSLFAISINMKNAILGYCKGIKKAIFKILDDLYNPY